MPARCLRADSAIISRDDMNGRARDHGLEFLLAFNGRIIISRRGTGSSSKSRASRPRGDSSPATAGSSAVDLEADYQWALARQGRVTTT
jgi:hypothetical protein